MRPRCPHTLQVRVLSTSSPLKKNSMSQQNKPLVRLEDAAGRDLMMRAVPWARQAQRDTGRRWLQVRQSRLQPPNGPRSHRASAAGPQGTQRRHAAPDPGARSAVQQERRYTVLPQQWYTLRGHYKVRQMRLGGSCPGAPADRNLILTPQFQKPSVARRGLFSVSGLGRQSNGGPKLKYPQS